MVDLLGIGFIGAYVAIIFDPMVVNKLGDYQMLDFLMQYNHGELILIIGYSLIAIFLVKFIFLKSEPYLSVMQTNSKDACDRALPTYKFTYSLCAKFGPAMRAPVPGLPVASWQPGIRLRHKHPATITKQQSC
mgnify:CR=1 FL=1